MINKNDYYWMGLIVFLVLISLNWGGSASPAMYLLNTNPWAALILVGLIIAMAIYKKVKT